MTGIFVRERTGRHALAAAAIGSALLIGAPMLGMGVVASLETPGPSVRWVRSSVPAPSVVVPATSRVADALTSEALMPTPGAVVLAGLGVLVATVRRRS